MKRISILLSLITLCLFTACKSEDDKEINVSLKNYTNALKSKDYVKMIAFMPPQIVESSGGAEYLLQTMKQGMASLEYKNLNYNNIQVVEDSEGTKVAVIDTEFIFTMGTQKTEVKTLGNIYGFSESKGTWYFIEGNDQSKNLLVSLVPEAVQKLNFRAAQVFVKQNGEWVKKQ